MRPVIRSPDAICRCRRPPETTCHCQRVRRRSHCRRRWPPARTTIRILQRRTRRKACRRLAGRSPIRLPRLPAVLNLPIRTRWDKLRRPKVRQLPPRGQPVPATFRRRMLILPRAASGGCRMRRCRPVCAEIRTPPVRRTAWRRPSGYRPSRRLKLGPWLVLTEQFKSNRCWPACRRRVRSWTPETSTWRRSWSGRPAPPVCPNLNSCRTKTGHRCWPGILSARAKFARCAAHWSYAARQCAALCSAGWTSAD